MERMDRRWIVGAPHTWRLGRLAALACASMLVAGCGASAAERASVNIATTAPPECRRVGAVSASANRAPTPEGNAEAARDELRGQAADVGGNLVVIEKEEDKDIVVRLAGTAYQCP